MSFIEMDFVSGGGGETPKEGTPDFYQEFEMNNSVYTEFDFGFHPSKIFIFTKDMSTNLAREFCFWGNDSNVGMDVYISTGAPNAVSMNVTTTTSNFQTSGNTCKYKSRYSNVNGFNAVCMAWKEL